MDENKRPKIACDIVIEKDGKILMGKRGNVFGKGTWALVGGHLEFKETTLECVIRELNEETGIKPTKFKLLGILNDIPNTEGQNSQYIRFVYQVSAFDGEVINKEPDLCDGWEWFDKNNLPEPVFVGHIKVIKFYMENGKDFFKEF
jgi:8-oxo-dGTP diphosphatase